MKTHGKCEFCGSAAGYDRLLCKICLQPRDFLRESDITPQENDDMVSYHSPIPKYDPPKKRKKVKRTAATRVVSIIQEPWTKRFYQFTFGMFWLMLNLMGFGFVTWVSFGIIACIVKYFAWRF